MTVQVGRSRNPFGARTCPKRTIRSWNSLRRGQPFRPRTTMPTQIVGASVFRGQTVLSKEGGLADGTAGLLRGRGRRGRPKSRFGVDASMPFSIGIATRDAASSKHAGTAIAWSVDT